MNYDFPVIKNIEQVLPIIKDKPEFIVIKKDGYTAIDYVVQSSDTFPPVTSPNDAILRECRGIIFDNETGKIIRRPHHKFFNYAEREETMPCKLDLTESKAFDKLDGSMIAPFVVNGQLLYGTKKGVTEISNQCANFRKNNPSYDEFSLYCIDKGLTPIYEWCSLQQKIVIEYKVESLTLTAVRNMETGVYVDLTSKNCPIRQKANELGIAIVSPIFDFSANVNGFIESVKDMKGIEGFVIVTKNGHKLKIKTEEYCTLHNAVDIFVSERKMFRLVVDGAIDDLKPLLTSDRVALVSDYEDGIFKGIKAIEKIIIELAQKGKQTTSTRKEYAKYVSTIDKKFSPFLFVAYDDENRVFESIIDRIKLKVHSKNE